jgi:pilus assembly protein CpaE
MRTIVICPDEQQRLQLEAVLKATPGLEVCKSLEECPEPESFARLVHAWVPDLVFLSIAALGAEAVNRRLATQFPHVRRIAVHSMESSDAFRRVIRWGMQELITLPIDRDAVDDLLARIAQDIEANPQPATPKGRVIAFVPAKAGAGASTIAANLTWALSQTTDTRVLLADFDSQSGMTGFIFRVDHEFGMDDAIRKGKLVDVDYWQRLVRPVGDQIDLLLAGRPRLGDADDPTRVPTVIDFARSRYTVVTADIPESWDSVSLAALREADQIFLVTTPELSSLRLARAKAALMRKLDLAEKASVILNRSKKVELNISEIESVVGLPMHACVPSDYQEVTESIRKARPSGALAESMKALAAGILNQKPAGEKRNKFLEQFVISPFKIKIRRVESKSAEPLRVTP